MSANNDVKNISGIYGIAMTSAAVMVAEIGSIGQFSSAVKLQAYGEKSPNITGSGGKIHSSGSSTINRRGHMSKEGTRPARWALSITVDTIILRNKPIHEYYDSVKNRNGSGKFAHVSTMRKLIRMIFTMLTERKEWKYESPALTQRKISKLEEI